MNAEKSKITSFEVAESLGCLRTAEPLRIGIPFAKNVIPKGAIVTLSDTTSSELSVPQCEVLSRWPDESARWVLLDWATDCAALGKKVIALHSLPPHSETPQVSQPPLTIEESADVLTIACETATLCFSKTSDFPCMVRYRSDSQEHSYALSTTITSHTGSTQSITAAHHCIEATGPWRVTICSRARIEFSDSPHLAELTARTHFYPHSCRMQIDLMIRNPSPAVHRDNFWDLGDSSSLLFKDFSFSVISKAGFEKAHLFESLHTISASAQNELLLVQRASGAQPTTTPDPSLHSPSPEHSYSAQMSHDGISSQHRRIQPSVSLLSKGVCCQLAVRKFWQNYPKVLHYRTTSCRVGLFPHEAHQSFELQGGEQKTQSICLSWCCSEHSLQPFAAWVEEPLGTTLPAEWYNHSQAAPYLPGAQDASDPAYMALVEGVIKGPRSFFVKREEIDEYGWRNFGDVFADHETAYSKDPLPIVSHYNNQFDVIQGLLYQYWRSGAKEFFALFCDMAEHVRDIDIYHTRKDRFEFNGGLFWHTNHYVDAQTASHRCYSRRHFEMHREPGYAGGGPSLHHCYGTGLLHHYLQTGDRFSLEAVQELFEFVSVNVIGPASLPQRIVKDLKSAAKKTIGVLKGICEPYDLDGPGRGAANALATLVDGWSFTGETRFLTACEHLLRRCISPTDNHRAMNLDNAELRWMYTLFLMAVAKYLHAKEEFSDSDRMYEYARDSLLHYVRWMAAHEKPYLQCAERLEYPTETWAVQELRKAICFFLAAKYVAHPERALLLEKGRFFYRQCFADLQKFPGKESYTRPQTILMRDGMIAHYYAVLNTKE